MITVGSLVYNFFEHHLKAEKGLSPASIRSYRDGIRLFLLFVAKKVGRPVTKLSLEDMTADQVRAFLCYLEAERYNHVRSRNQRLTMLHTFFAFAAGRVPELLHEAERVAAIPQKRCQPPSTNYLERDEIEAFFAQLPKGGRYAVRDRAVLLFLYNTGARASEAVGASIQDLSLAPPNSGFTGVRVRSCGDAITGQCANNTIVYSGRMATNGATAQPDIGLFVPFIWPNDMTKSPTQQAISWNNRLNGWYSQNFDNLGTSLLVTLDIPTPNNTPNGTVLAGQVADGTGVSVFGPSSDSPNVGAPYPPETLAATDALPFVDLGSFAAGESKPFSLIFTYTFGDGRSCGGYSADGAS